MNPFHQTIPPRKTLPRWLGIFLRCRRHQCTHHFKRTEVTLKRIGTVGITTMYPSNGIHRPSRTLFLQVPEGDDGKSLISFEMYAFDPSILVD